MNEKDFYKVVTEFENVRLELRCYCKQNELHFNATIENVAKYLGITSQTYRNWLIGIAPTNSFYRAFVARKIEDLKYQLLSKMTGGVLIL